MRFRDIAPRGTSVAYGMARMATRARRMSGLYRFHARETVSGSQSSERAAPEKLPAASTASMRSASLRLMSRRRRIDCAASRLFSVGESMAVFMAVL